MYLTSITLSSKSDSFFLHCLFVTLFQSHLGHSDLISVYYTRVLIHIYAVCVFKTL